MKYAKILPNDYVNGTGISISIWMQGCPHKCKGCHNPELWSFEGAIIEKDDIFFERLKNYIYFNKVPRNVSILGGEPFCKENIEDTFKIIRFVKEHFPTHRITVWTGYKIEELPFDRKKYNLKDIDIIVDGPYEEDKRTVILPLRGSTNQRILFKNFDF